MYQRLNLIPAGVVEMIESHRNSHRPTTRCSRLSEPSPVEEADRRDAEYAREPMKQAHPERARTALVSLDVRDGHAHRAC